MGECGLLDDLLGPGGRVSASVEVPIGAYDGNVTGE